MLADIKNQILPLINLRFVLVMLPAVVLSILAGMAMYAMGYPSMVYAEVVFILETLMYLVLGVYSALKAVFYGIVVAGLLLVFLLPVLIILRQIQKRRNLPLAASSPTPVP